MPQLKQADPSDALARNRLTAPVWGGPIALEQYLERERRLDATNWARGGKRTWIWRDQSQVFASCETYQMASLWNGVPGSSIAIASVFVEPEKRSQGHATALLQGVRTAMQGET